MITEQQGKVIIGLLEAIHIKKLTATNKWEYRSSINIIEEVSSFDKRVDMDKFENPMNSYGEEGWELVSMTNFVPSGVTKGKGWFQGVTSFLCVWKRPVAG